VIVAVHGLAGGVGSSTLAANLAWELILSDKETPPQVCLIDLDLQTGSAGTYLDLPRRDAVYELLSDMASMDKEAFMQALQTFQDHLKVLTAPAEMLPLDLIDGNDVTKLLEVARESFDYVVIDMPHTLVQWTETVLTESHVYLNVMELDMRSAQNALRFIRALRSENLPTAKLRFVLNRAPRFTDLTARSRVKRMAESLDISFAMQLPDGGAAVTQSCDHGLPLASSAPKNALRKEIQKLAVMVQEHQEEEAAEL
jgi:pilus assembly protein CpaE